MSDCLHCDINELVRERIESQETVDLGDLLAELIMIAPKDQGAALLAEAVGHLGQTMLGDMEEGASDTAH